MISQYAELGVILLLFTIGLEISFRDLLRASHMLIIGGALQLLLTTGVVSIVAIAFGLSPPVAAVFGVMIAVSSTTIVMAALGERGERSSPQGRFLLSVLIFQDLAVVPIMLLLPVLAGDTLVGLEQLPLALARGGIILAVILVSLRWGVPTLLYHAARIRSSEVFLFSVVAICILTVYLSGMLGLSFAFGAFLAGLLIADSEFRHETMAIVLPFRDLFAGIFFVSIGMLLEIQFLLDQPFLVAGLTVGIVLVKTLPGMLSARALGLSVRPVVIGGLSLAHVGEFSFVIANSALALGLLLIDQYQLFLNAAVVSMATAPFLIRLSCLIGDRLVDSVPQRRGAPEPALLAGHLVIVGFGLSGQKISRVARESGIEYRIIEANPETVRRMQQKGEPIIFGDAAHAGVLEWAGVNQARMLVCVISDPGAVARVVRTARRMNPGLFIAVRVRYAAEIEGLRAAGADEVVAEEFEALIELVTRVLSVYMVPFNEIEGYVDRVRADGYAMFRSLRASASGGVDIEGRLYNLDIRTYRIAVDSSIAGRRLDESRLREDFNATVLAVRRGLTTISNPSPGEPLLPGDVVVLFGSPASLAGVGSLFTGPEKKE